MKKILIFLTLILSFAFVKAQDLTINLNDASTGYYGTVFGTSGTSLVTSTAIVYKIRVSAPFPVLPHIQLDCARVSGGPAFTAKVEESLTDSAYYAIAWLGNVTKTTSTLADTTVNFYSKNARMYSRYIKITVTPTSTVQSATIKGKITLVKAFKGQ